MELITLFLSTVLIDNIILVHFFGFCPLLGVTKSRSSALGMGLAVLFVILGASIFTWVLYNYVLVSLNLTYLKLITFILVIACFVQFTEMFLKRYAVGLYKSLGIFLPLITTNCAVLYTALQNVNNSYNFIEMIVNAIGVSTGFILIVYIFAMIRERLNSCNTPKSFAGNPIALITAGLMALAFSGLAGMI